FDPDASSVIVGVFILAQMAAALGIVRNVRLAWWACLVCSGVWSLFSLLFVVTVPMLMISHPQRPCAKGWIPLWGSFLTTVGPTVLSLWLYFRRRGEMFSSMLIRKSRRAT